MQCASVSRKSLNLMAHMGTMIQRRAFLMSLCLSGTPQVAAAASIDHAPIEIAGDWRHSLPGDVHAVVTRMRDACLAGLPLRSDRQPQSIRVRDNTSGPPYVWLHTDEPTTAVIAVDVGERDWCNLAYQFGHELGHVFANSWQWGDVSRNPTQWLEEAVVESFSIRGLARLADSWERSPPFPRDNAYANAIRDYRERLLGPDRAQAHEQGGDASLAAWYARQAEHLATHGSVDSAKPAAPAVVRLLEANDDAVADIGAMNRWPDRTGIPLEDYLDRWKASCAELGLTGTLPRQLRGELLPLR